MPKSRLTRQPDKVLEVEEKEKEKEEEEEEEKEKEEEKEEKILYMCESIGHRPLRGCCPKVNKASMQEKEKSGRIDKMY